jgi:hypothetical protein
MFASVRLWTFPFLRKDSRISAHGGEFLFGIFSTYMHTNIATKMRLSSKKLKKNKNLHGYKKEQQFHLSCYKQRCYRKINPEFHRSSG